MESAVSSGITEVFSTLQKSESFSLSASSTGSSARVTSTSGWMP